MTRTRGNLTTVRMDSDEGGRELRESVSVLELEIPRKGKLTALQDDPLRQWAEDHTDSFLAELLRSEGRGDHRDYPACGSCSKAEASHRCLDCLGGGRLHCGNCIVAAHCELPFHRVEVSNL